MTDILKQLGRASWREIEFPVAGRDYGFRHEQARHKYIFRDNALIESLGRENPTYSYTIPFREDIARGPYRSLFVDVYPQFLEACLDRDQGVLEDPVHGAVPAKCVSLREVVDVNRRDGVDVEVEFVFAPSDFTATDLGAQIQTLEGARASAGAFDDTAERVDWEQEPPPEPVLDPFDVVSSIGNRAEASVGKVIAKLDDAAFRARKARDTIDRLKRPPVGPARNAAIRLWGAATSLKEEAGLREREVKDGVVGSTPITFMALAGSHNNSVRDFIRLNPLLYRHPIVPAKSRYRFYTDRLATPRV